MDLANWGSLSAIDPISTADLKRLRRAAMRGVRSVSSGSSVPVNTTSSPRAQTGRQVKAARLLAGGISIHVTARAAGMSYLHLVAVEHGEQPLLPSDAVDLGRVLGVPASWLANGWSSTEAA